MEFFKFLQFFEKLADLPLLNACEHLNFVSLLLASYLSKKWEKMIKIGGERSTSKWNVKITQDKLAIQLKFAEDEENFKILIKEDPDLSEELKIDLNKRANQVTFTFKTASQLETASYRILNLIKFLYPPCYDRITCSLRSRCPDFPLKFLENLPRGYARVIDIQGDLEVDGKSLMAFLRNVQVQDYRYPFKKCQLDVGVRIKNLGQCDEIVLGNKNQKIADARFLTPKSLLKLDFSRGEFGENNFTSADFNAFLRSWMERRERRHFVYEASFAIREDQGIRMEEVMSGLNAHVGKPRIRDRWLIPNLSLSRDETGWPLTPKAIDLNDGWDIINNNFELATVILEPNRLRFIAVPERTSWQTYTLTIEVAIRYQLISLDEKIQLRNAMLDSCEDDVDELYDDENLTSVLDVYQEAIDCDTDYLFRYFELQEMIKAYGNDD